MCVHVCVKLSTNHSYPVPIELCLVQLLLQGFSSQLELPLFLMAVLCIGDAMVNFSQHIQTI